MEILAHAAPLDPTVSQGTAIRSIEMSEKPSSNRHSTPITALCQSFLAETKMLSGMLFFEQISGW